MHSGATKQLENAELVQRDLQLPCLTQGNKTYSLFSFLILYELLIFLILISFSSPSPLNTYLFPLSVCPSRWWIQMQPLWGCLGLRLILSKRILKVHFPPLCLQLLIFLSEATTAWTKIVTTCLLFLLLGMKPTAPRGESGFLSVGMVTLRKDESKVSYSLLRDSLWHPSFWESK